MPAAKSRDPGPAATPKAGDLTHGSGSRNTREQRIRFPLALTPPLPPPHHSNPSHINQSPLPKTLCPLQLPFCKREFKPPRPPFMPGGSSPHTHSLLPRKRSALHPPPPAKAQPQLTPRSQLGSAKPIPPGPRPITPQVLPHTLRTAQPPRRPTPGFTPQHQPP